MDKKEAFIVTRFVEAIYVEGLDRRAYRKKMLIVALIAEKLYT